MDTTMTTTELLRTREAAAYAGVSACYLRRLAMRGRGPAVAERRGVGCKGGNLYERQELDRWAADRRAQRGHLDA